MQNCCRPSNLSVYAADGAVINGVVGTWRPGEVQKSWEEIRPTFWFAGTKDDPARFLLGDFLRFARFCALSQAKEMMLPVAPMQLGSALQSGTVAS